MTTTRRRFIGAILIAISLDIAGKLVAVATLSDTSVDFRWVELRLVRNDGVAFGLATAAPPVALVLVTSLVLVALVVGVWRGAIPAGIPAGLIVGGATANVLDRLTGGSVIDMLDLGWWPAFNLADVFIMAGTVLLLLASLRMERSSLQTSGPGFGSIVRASPDVALATLSATAGSAAVRVHARTLGTAVARELSHRHLLFYLELDSPQSPQGQPQHGHPPSANSFTSSFDERDLAWPKIALVGRGAFEVRHLREFVSQARQSSHWGSPGYGQLRIAGAMKS